MNTKFYLNRHVLAVGFTLGLLATGASTYSTVEDQVRPNMYVTQQGKVVGKVDGETAIPAGTYEIIDTYSPRFKKNMLRLVNVKTHEGVLIHAGNTALDSSGCILVGTTATKNGVAHSKEALAKFEKEAREALKKGKLFIEIKDVKP